MVGEDVLVNFAHMELAEPTIAQGFCRPASADGATDIVAFPYMLSPGKHSTRDIPRMVAEAAAGGIPSRHLSASTEAFGMSSLLAEVVAHRSGRRRRQPCCRRHLPLLGNRSDAWATAAPRARDASHPPPEPHDQHAAHRSPQTMK